MRRLNGTALICGALLLVAGGAAWGAEWREIVGEGFTFTEVRPGIFQVRGSGAVFAGCNGALIVNDGDALLVDSHMTPAAARALLADLPRVTDRPLRYVVNTHFHFDHVHGNQVFGPEVEIISHETTRRRIAAGDSMRGRGWDTYITPMARRIASAEAELPGADAERRRELEAGLAEMRAFSAQLDEIRPTAPTLALREAVSLFRGGREIRVLFLGRGHTDGDVVVYLPAEKVLAAGDLLAAHVVFAGDGYLLEWADTLERLKALEVEIILPGHGPPIEEMERISWYQEYLRDLWPKIVAMHENGVPAAEAARQIDMTTHAAHFPAIEGPGARLDAVERAYELLDRR